MSIFSGSERKAELHAQLHGLKNEVAECHEQIGLNMDEAERLSLTYDLSRAPKWDYRVEDDIDQDALNKLGRSGWELVNVVSFTTGYEIEGSGRLRVHSRFFFKVKRSPEWPEEAKPYVDAAEGWRKKGREKYDEWEVLNAELGSSI